MRIKRVYLLIYISMIILSLTSCHKISGNIIYFERVSDNIGDNEIEINIFWDLININKNNKTYSISNGDFSNTSAVEYAVYGGTAPRYSIEIKEEYEKIKDDIMALNTLGESAVLYTQGCLGDCFIFGICNVYNDTVGYFSAGGNYAEEEIAYSVYYKYDYINDIMETICKLDNSTMIAYNGDFVLYWENKKFYSYNIQSQEVKELCEHLSYDSGFRHQSTTKVYFNNTYVIFEMRKNENFNDRYYFYLYEYGKDIIELTEKKD